MIGAYGAASVGMGIFMAASMQFLWGMVNTIQMMTHLSLLSLTFPSNCLSLYKIIINIANFEFLDSEGILNKMFFNQFDEEEESFNTKFDLLGYGALNMIMNLGTGFIIFLLTMMLIFVLIVFYRFLTALPWIFGKFFKKLYKSMVYNAAIRYMTEAYLELTLTAFVNI